MSGEIRAVGEHDAPPTVSVALGFLLGGDSQCDAAVEGYAFKLHAEALAIGVRPGGPDPGPKSLLAFTLANLVGDVGWRAVRRFVGHNNSFRRFRTAPIAA
jgi:hypothetical protein